MLYAPKEVNMQCACLVDRNECDLDWDEACKAKHVISKTAHKCVECGCKIKPGDRYLLEIVQWEEGLEKDRYKTCSDCESLRDTLVCSWQYGSVLEDIYCALDALPEDGIPWAAFAKLAPGAKDYVFGIIEKWWEETAL